MYNGIGWNMYDQEKPKCQNVVTGWWSYSAGKELRKYGEVHDVLGEIPKNELAMPNLEKYEWKPTNDCQFVNYCDNETGTGFEFNDSFPYEKFGDTPIFADMSSNIGSKRIDWNKLGGVYACAQKNLGPTGVTFMILREDLIKEPLDICPTSQSWKVAEETTHHIFNTPDVAAVYMLNLQLQDSLRKGGIEFFEEEQRRKSKFLYKLIDASNGFYHNHVDEKYRSRCNVTFRINGGDEFLENKFNVFCREEFGINYIEGHHSLKGGHRLSVYNSQPMDAVHAVAQAMEEFQKENQKYAK